MSPTSSPTLSTILQFPLIFLLFSFHFSVRKAHITIFGDATWMLKAFPNIVTNNEQHPGSSLQAAKPPQAHYHKQQAPNSADCHKFSWGKKSLWPCSSSERMWPCYQEHNHVTMLPACEQASGELTMTQTTYQPLVATQVFLWPSPMVLK